MFAMAEKMECQGAGAKKADDQRRRFGNRRENQVIEAAEAAQVWGNVSNGPGHIGDLARHVRIVAEALAHIIQFAREVTSDLARLHAAAVRQVIETLRIPTSPLAAHKSAPIAASAELVPAILVAAALALSLPGLLAVFALTLSLTLALSLTLLIPFALSLALLLTRLLTALFAVLALLVARLLPPSELLDLPAQALYLS